MRWPSLLTAATLNCVECCCITSSAVKIWRVVRSALEERRRERTALDVEMARDVRENAGERAESEIRVVRDRDVMFATVLRREAHVAARFARHLVPITA